MNRKPLFDYLRRALGTLTQTQVNNVNFLLDFIGGTFPHLSKQQIAYILATVHHETGGRFEAIREIKASPIKNPKIWAMQRKYWDTGFYGRGAIQLTWKKNYLLAEHVLAKYGVLVDLIKNPDAMLDWRHSAIVAVDGMVNGWFTGIKLADYIASGHTNYYDARRVVNGTFHAERVAKLAREYEAVL